MRQTAVEWLENEIFRKYKFIFQNINCQPLEKAISQAKEMEKQQAESIWKASDKNMHSQFSSSAYKPITFEQYYKENYETE